jgi:hypothetical protein
MMEGLKTTIVNGPVPGAWVEAGTVDKIYIYPMKSGRGCRVPEAQVKEPQ